MTAPFKLRPYQVAAIEGARRAFVGDKAAGIDPARAVIVTMPTGCHARGQAIMLADYSCAAVEDIAVGDLLAGPDLQPRRVLELHRGRQVMVRIRPTDGAQPWEVNLDHVLTLAVRGQDPTQPAGRARPTRGRSNRSSPSSAPTSSATSCARRSSPSVGS